MVILGARPGAGKAEGTGQLDPIFVFVCAVAAAALCLEKLYRGQRLLAG